MTIARRIKLTIYCVFLFGAAFFIISLLSSTPLFRSRIQIMLIDKNISSSTTSDSIAKAGYALDILMAYLTGDAFLADLSLSEGDSLKELLSKNHISSNNWTKHIEIRTDNAPGVATIGIEASSPADAERLAGKIAAYLNRNTTKIVNNDSLELRQINGPTKDGQVITANTKQLIPIGVLTGLAFALILQLMLGERADRFMYSSRNQRGAKAIMDTDPAQTALNMPMPAQSAAAVEERAIRERLNRLINGEL